MTTTALPPRSTDLSPRWGSRPRSDDVARPAALSDALDRADLTLSAGRHTAPAARRQPTSRPAPHRPPGATAPTAPPAAGQVLRRRALRDAEPPRPSWDRMRFLPALPQDPEPEGCDALALSTIRESRAHTQRQSLPDPVRTAQVVVTAAAEVLAGWRPAEHLSRWTSPELFHALARRAGLARRILGEVPDPRPRVRTMRVQLTAGGACEVCAVLDDGGRVRGAGARLEPHRGRWLLTSLEIA
ncbi:Rv3235 family protein [Actinomyces sp. W5033]|uniref:Rv3235 family protein n=1 Tax=Actinomyces sp. W5033 TaxID=3446479 RepID=UPI003EE2B870